MPEQSSNSLSKRFRELRERARISENEAAQQLGFTVFDLEAFDDELTTCHSPSDVRKFCRVLNTTPSELFGIQTDDPPVFAHQLVALIRAECSKRGVTLEQFEDAVGWRLGQSMVPPERLLEDMTIDGLQWLCRELGINWHRVILSL
jgi:transcriptional regulator with XRE-family HTH domain